MSEIHEIGGVRHQIYQRIIFWGQLAGIIIWIHELWINVVDRMVMCAEEYRKYPECSSDITKMEAENVY